MNKSLIIIGGGASVKEGLELGLKDKLKDKFTCGLNYAYKYFDNCTYHCFVDKDFYTKQSHELAKLPLIIGKSGGYNPLPNTIDLPTATKYTRDLQGGTYSPELTGLFALSLGIFLIDVGTIYCLGFDFGEFHTKNIEDRPLTLNDKPILKYDSHKKLMTHFYQGEFNHRGIGKTSYYNAKNRPRDKFQCYTKETKVKIYNVSVNSRIPSTILEKISYKTFFEKLGGNGRCSHIEARKEIRSKLNA